MVAKRADGALGCVTPSSGQGAAPPPSKATAGALGPGPGSQLGELLQWWGSSGGPFEPHSCGGLWFRGESEFWLRAPTTGEPPPPFQVLQDMGLPTGAEGKESGKGDESAEEAEQKPVVVPPPPVVEAVSTPSAASPPSDQTSEVGGLVGAWGS